MFRVVGFIREAMQNTVRIVAPGASQGLQLFHVCNSYVGRPSSRGTAHRPQPARPGAPSHTCPVPYRHSQLATSRSPTYLNHGVVQYRMGLLLDSNMAFTSRVIT